MYKVDVYLRRKIRKMRKFGLVTLLFFIAITLAGQNKNTGKITGTVVEKGSGMPIEYANIQLFTLTDKTLVEGTISDPKGNFTIKNIPAGTYRMTVSFIGYETSELPEIHLTKEKSTFNAGKIALNGSSQDLGEVSVVGRKSMYTQTIDKKVFSVGDDLTSSSGSVSELMQNIPSLQVDIEGNVSLRGSENVQILINGKPSALMGKNRASVLQQLPANSIERVEIITNPSAKYKPDGTAGIINLIIKKERKEGFNGSVTGNAGNKSRYNSTVALNYHTGKVNLMGSYGLRFDQRDRFTKDNRIQTDALTGEKSYLLQTIPSYARPVSHIAQTGIEWEINDKNSFEASANYNYMGFVRKENTLTQSEDKNQLLTNEYNRNRYDVEYQKELELAAKYTRKFGKDQELTIDYTHNGSNELEDNKYTNQYHFPVIPDSKDNTLISQKNYENLLRINFLKPMSGKDSQLELGYELEADKSDMNFKIENLVGSSWIPDIEKTNRFKFDENVHSLYGTYQHSFGRFGVLGGVRAEQSFITSHLITLDSLVQNNYFSVYPTLHTSFNINETNQLQLNYSKRINRPEGDDMNPFPEYRDPYNIKAGNPKLKPEQIHSVEAGYHYHKGATTYAGSIYYRYIYNKLTEITRYKNDSVLLTTKENLASSSSAGIEAIVNHSFGNLANLNLNMNGYFNQLDAANLGYSGSKNSFGWNAALNSNINITKLFMVQLNLKYTSTVQTAQGERKPTFIVNSGARYDIFKKNASLMLTVSDLFDTFRSRTIVNIPGLHQEVESRRTPRIIYLGFSYRFGQTAKKGKETQLKYEE